MAKKMEAKMGGNVCGPGCYSGMCGKCRGGKYLVLGILIILNAVYGWFTWGVFVGGIVALAGILKCAWPCCPHCK